MAPPDPNEGEVELPDLSDEAKAGPPATQDAEQEESAEETQKFATDLAAVYDVQVNVSAVLGKTNMEVSELLKLGRGAIVELDRKIGEAIDIYVNNRLVARGEVVVVEDRLGITMTEIVKGGLQ
jgi:flagellar motor switch protein FliN